MAAETPFDRGHQLQHNLGLVHNRTTNATNTTRAAKHKIGEKEVVRRKTLHFRVSDMRWSGRVTGATVGFSLKTESLVAEEGLEPPTHGL